MFTAELKYIYLHQIASYTLVRRSLDVVVGGRVSRFVIYTFAWFHSFAKFTFSNSLARGSFFAFPVKICHSIYCDSVWLIT